MILCQECQTRDPEQQYGICWFDDSPTEKSACSKWNVETYVVYHLGQHKMNTYSLIELIDLLKTSYSVEVTRVRLQKLLRQMTYKKTIACQEVSK